jgi:N-acetyl-anhydromuramyl-L-alanine amidase AmpD
MNWIIHRYNKKSSKRYGWHPSWFDDHLSEFNSELIDCIKWFQLDHDLKADGMVGPITFRRLLSERELKEAKNYIIVNNQHVEIDWDVKIDLMPNNCYRKWSRARKPNMIVTHWDATTSAEKCKRVLQARKISTHFCIDNDGVIYQYVDTNHVAWHAGGVNKYSIGVDFSNAYYLKYNNHYVKKGFNKRPVCKNSRVHGVKLKPHLGYYPVQIEAYKKLLQVLCEQYDIPVQTPMINDSVADTGVHSEAKRGKYDGIVCHYHVSRNKIDCAGLDLKSIVSQLH